MHLLYFEHYELLFSAKVNKIFATLEGLIFYWEKA